MRHLLAKGRRHQGTSRRGTCCFRVCSSLLSSGVSLRGSFLWRSFIGCSVVCANDVGLIVGKGLVEVRNPMNYGLRGGFPVPNTKVVTEIYSISMFHQLYCLVWQLSSPINAPDATLSFHYPPFTKRENSQYSRTPSAATKAQAKTKRRKITWVTASTICARRSCARATQRWRQH